MPLSQVHQKIINAFIILFTLGTLFSVIALFYLFVFPLFDFSLLWRLIHLTVQMYLIYSLLYFYIKCVLSPPSIQPLLYNTLFPNYLEEYGERKCDICNCSKPLRTHHCSTCKKCVGRYDHHCLLICNCIGDYTLRLFFNTIFYFFIGSIYLLLMISYLYINTHFENFDLVLIGCCCAIFGLSIAIFISMGLYLLYYLYLIKHNFTTIEVIATFTKPTRVLDYNRGFKNNWREIMLYKTDVHWIFSIIPIDPIKYNKTTKNE